MDIKIVCNKCSREMGLVEFLTYVEAYFLKLIVPAAVSFIISAVANKLSKETSESRGIIDETMSGLANNFSIECPHCKQIDWSPISCKKTNKLNQKEENLVN
ncbi:hypothetical protein K9L05_03995 [Candidatus Babeliales bacterium]|nr:hypothetical protein [Candidatus Babeliales bacterium]MCF7899779.1 hypothetical protein [Candidatus Babeliales bacterium]